MAETVHYGRDIITYPPHVASCGRVPPLVLLSRVPPAGFAASALQTPGATLGSCVADPVSGQPIRHPSIFSDSGGAAIP